MKGTRPMAEEHKTKTNPSGSVQQCDQRHIHGPHEWQNEFGGYFNVYCPGNDGKPKDGTVEWDIDANKPAADIDPTVNLDTWEPGEKLIAPDLKVSYPAEIIPMESELEKELGHLLNRYSAENESGTPDFILAMYLNSQLALFNQTIKDRAAWRGESVELPALQRLRQDSEMVQRTAAYFKQLVESGVIVVHTPLEATDIYREIMDMQYPPTDRDLAMPGFEAGDTQGPEGKDVPLITYSHGQKNEIGIANVKVTPGEMAVEGKDVTAAEAVLEDAPLNEPKDEPQSEASTDAPQGRFERYQKRGLSS
jgi:hypothetical protein